MSLPVRGAWVEISCSGGGRSAGGLSLPVRGAWVEIAHSCSMRRRSVCRSPCGERGLKLRKLLHNASSFSRSPCGERGLKSRLLGVRVCTLPSLPVRGAWVEIGRGSASCRRKASLPVRGAWVEISATCPMTSMKSRRSPCGERGLKSAQSSRRYPLPLSLPVRGAWVEMESLRNRGHPAIVAPRAGSVG